jgi:hypothetical protein
MPQLPPARGSMPPLRPETRPSASPVNAQLSLPPLSAGSAAFSNSDLPRIGWQLQSHMRGFGLMSLTR